MPVKPPTFRTAAQGSITDSAKVYERERGSARQRGYTPAWDRLSKLFLAAHPLCLGCEAVGMIEPSVVTDHVEPHNGDQVKFWDSANNWQPSCRWHHDVIKQQIEALWAVGKAKLSDLWLNSVLAMELTRAQQR